MGKKISVVILILSFLLFCFAAFQLYENKQGDVQAEQSYNELIENVVTETPADEEIEVPPPFSINWEDEALTNAVGWLYVPSAMEGYDINFPVAQNPENDDDFYLYHALDGKWSRMGTPFIPANCQYDGNKLTIHGHNYGAGETIMFSALHQFQKEGYVEENPSFWYAVKGEQLKEYEIIGVTKYDINEITDGWDYLQVDFEEESLEDWLLRGYGEFNVWQGSSVPERCDKLDGRIIILSTCQTIYYGGQYRCLVIGLQK